MKNFRNGVDDVSPPLRHEDRRLRFTHLRIGGQVALIGPGPLMDAGPLPMMKPFEILDMFAEAVLSLKGRA